MMNEIDVTSLVIIAASVGWNGYSGGSEAAMLPRLRRSLGDRLLMILFSNPPRGEYRRGGLGLLLTDARLGDRDGDLPRILITRQVLLRLPSLLLLLLLLLLTGMRLRARRIGLLLTRPSLLLLLLLLIWHCGRRGLRTADFPLTGVRLRYRP